MTSAYSAYTSSPYAASRTYAEKTGTLTLHGRIKNDTDYNHIINQQYKESNNNDSLNATYESERPTRQRLLSTSDRADHNDNTQADSSTTTSGSSYGESVRDEGISSGATENESETDSSDAQSGLITDAERLQIETFFNGLKTQIYVCSSLANLYVKSAASNAEWELRYTGIPVVILDTGEARSRAKRRIQIILAERGTCFTLWRDTIDNLSAYKISGRGFHTMFLSSDHTQMIGFSFDNVNASHDIWTYIEQLVSDPENISLSTPGRKKKKKTVKKTPRMPLPPKSHISQPCCFQHITNVDVNDRGKFFSMQVLVPILNEINGSNAVKRASHLESDEEDYHF